MSKQNPPTKPGTVEEGRQYEARPIELDRGDHEQPQLKWLVVEEPDQSFLLEEDDYILDSYFNPEHDIWEVLIRLDAPEDEE